MNSAPLIIAMRQCLQDGEMLVDRLGDREYAERCPEVLNASVGGHYRHVLDHFRNLLENDPEGRVDYDRRRRDTPVETVRQEALAETRRLSASLDLLDSAWAEREVQVCSQISHGDVTSPLVKSTIGREAVFCIMHAVHHYALIRVICGLMGQKVPASFGLAPSTVSAAACSLQSAGSCGL